MTEGTPTRGEFELLRRSIEDTARRLDQIDTGGTRGVGALAVQVADLIKDVGDVRAEQREHRREHEDEARQRAAARRWMIATIIALFAAIEGPLAIIAAHLH